MEDEKEIEITEEMANAFDEEVEELNEVEEKAEEEEENG